MEIKLSPICNAVQCASFGFWHLRNSMNQMGIVNIKMSNLLWTNFENLKKKFSIIHQDTLNEIELMKIIS
jgi:hypothetical protein